MRASLLLGCVIACGHPADEPAEATPPAQVTCQAVTTHDVEEIVEVSGVVAPQPKLDAVISSPIAGRVAQVAIEEGDRVAAGALLAVIEDPALPAGSVEAKAGVASAQAARQAADQELARQTRLVDSGIGARRDLDDARAKAAAASAELDAASARDHLASQRLARRELRAPFAGVVLHVWKRAGESVEGSTSTPVAEVADLTVLEIRAQVSPGVLVKLKDGLTAQVHMIGVDAAIAGIVSRVSPAVDPTTMLGTVRIQLPSAQTAPPVGSAATAQIAIAHHPGLVVPASAQRRSAVGTDELVACEAGVAKIRPVTIGHRGDTVEITKGLAAGEQIVIDHVLGIDDGQALVAPTAPIPKAAKAAK